MSKLREVLGGLGFMSEVSKERPGLPDKERRALLEAPEGETISLSDFEAKFPTPLDVPEGYFSSYYRDDPSPIEGAEKRRQLDIFLDDKK